MRRLLSALLLGLLLAPLGALGQGADAPGPGAVPTPAHGTQLLTAASGNFTVPPGVDLINFAMTGGGAGGGGVANAAASAPGGSTGVFLAGGMRVTPGQVIPFTNGAGGLGGAAGNNAGQNGGDTTFGGFTAKGGLGGNGSASGNAATPTALNFKALADASRAAPTTAAWLNALTVGGSAAGSAGLGGANTGTSHPWAISGAQVGPNAAGLPGTTYGGAGSGATSSTGGAFAGGDGFAGAIEASW
jgi:hypothetical protein